MSNATISPNDNYNITPVTPFGEVLTQGFKVQTVLTGRYGLNTKIAKFTESNGGTVTIDNSRYKLSTGVAVNGLARVESVLPLRYLNGITGREIFTAVFATPAANSRQLFGLMNDGGDRIVFGYNGLTMVTGYKRGSGAYNFTNYADFNGSWPVTNTAPGVINFQNLNIFEILFQWLGAGPHIFRIKDPTHEDAGFLTFNALRYNNTNPLPHTLNPTFKLFAEVENTGNNTNIVAYTPSMSGGLEGDNGSQNFNPLNFHGVLSHSTSFSDTNNNHLITIRNKSLFPSTDTNIVPVIVNRIKTISNVSGATIVTARIYKNATTAIALAGWTSYDSTNSPTEYSTTTTTVTGGTIIGYATMTAGDTSDVIQFAEREAYLNPGETLTVSITDSAAPATTSIATINFTDLL